MQRRNPGIGLQFDGHEEVAGSCLDPRVWSMIYPSRLTPALTSDASSSCGYALGSISKPGLSSMRIYDGNDLVNDSGGKVISVLIQYRLGLFGFLAGADVKKHGVLNAGLRTYSPLSITPSTQHSLQGISSLLWSGSKDT